jgi:hypothetical protein
MASRNPLITTYQVILEGTTPIMFDRFVGEQTKLEPWQKLYFLHDKKTVGFPAKNVMSFLSSQNTDSAPKRLMDSRKYKAFCAAALSYIQIAPILFPFLRDGQPIVFGKLQRTADGTDEDPMSGILIDHDTARLPKGIPNPKQRPVLPLPWMLAFQLSLFENKDISQQALYNLFVDGGRMVGFGTNRGVYGKFEVMCFDAIDS